MASSISPGVQRYSRASRLTALLRASGFLAFQMRSWFLVLLYRRSVTVPRRMRDSGGMTSAVRVEAECTRTSLISSSKAGVSGACAGGSRIQGCCQMWDGNGIRGSAPDGRRASDSQRVQCTMRPAPVSRSFR